MMYSDPKLWASLMGCHLEKADLQPLEPVDDGAAVRIGGKGREQTLPLTIEEHPPDILGPRFVDELRADRVVRHAIPGLSRDEWDAGRVGELERLLCSEPFRVDPIPAIVDGDDWVAWMTRNRVLAYPAPDDDVLRTRLAVKILGRQHLDGSWGALPATAFAILNLLALGIEPSQAHIRAGAEWLLSQPEPPPRPGMWMLNQGYLDEWVSKRKPQEQRQFAPGEFHWVPPDDEINYYSWRFPDHEQDQFRGQEMQQVVPTCARHHPPACEPRMVHVSGVVAEALLRCGYADHPRLRRYVNTLFHLGGEWGYWCGCGALGLYDSGIPASEATPDLDARRVAEDGRRDLSPWRWVADVTESARLANKPNVPEQGTHAEPFVWFSIPGQEHLFALIGSGWQNGDCWVKTNRALSQHPGRPGSLTEHLAIYQASRYQTSLGEWSQGFPAGMLAFLSLYDHATAQMLAIKSVPWLQAHQADDGLWHHDTLPRSEWGKPAYPVQPRLATYHIVAALNRFGTLDRLRP
jgi:hypothetical protein